MQDTTKEKTTSQKLDIPRLQRDDDEKSRSLLTRKPVSVKGSSSIVLLYQNIQERNWDKVFVLLEKNVHNSKSWVEEFNPDGSLRWRSLPIHLICEKDPPLDLVRELLRLYPQSLLQKNHGQELPIHIACRQGASKEVIRQLLEKSPETATIPDCEGRLPLHLACCNHAIDQTTIQDLIYYNERATRTPDDFGLLPLHWACTKRSPSKIVETVIKAYPFAIEHKDCYGKTPMDRVMSHGHPEKAKILELLSRDVSSWSKGMMSTIVDLSSKLGSYDKVKRILKQREEECMHLINHNKQYKDEIKYVTNKWHEEKEEFKEQMHQLQRKHFLESKRLEEKIQSQISTLKREKEASEKKVIDLKIIVDELVEQLKEQNSTSSPGVHDNNQRKQLKAKVVQLLDMLNKTRSELDKVKEENTYLTMQCKQYGHSHDRGPDRGKGYKITKGDSYDDDSLRYLHLSEERST